MPIYDPTQQISYLREFMILFNPGDMVKFKSVDRAGYDETVEDVGRGKFEPRIRPVTFSLDEFHRDPSGYNRKLEEALNGN